MTVLQGPLADRDSWSAVGGCPIEKTMAIIGTRSAMLILREAYYGTSRFDDFARRVGITKAATSARLAELVDCGLLERRPYREPGQRTRYEYVLTQMGRDLLPAALALMQWGDKYLSDQGGPIAVSHADCGAPVQAEVHCAEGHPVPLGELRARFR